MIQIKKKNIRDNVNGKLSFVSIFFSFSYASLKLHFNSKLKLKLFSLEDVIKGLVWTLQ